MSNIIDQAIAHHKEGRLKQAVKLYEQELAQITAPNPSLYYYAGMAYFGLEKFGKAEAYLAKAAEAAPNNAEILVGYGNALYKLKRNKKALPIFQTALSLDGSNPVIWFNFGNVTRALKQYNTAIEAFTKALVFNPTLTQALANLAETLIAHKDFIEFSHLIERVFAFPLWKEHFSNIALLGIPDAAKAKKASGNAVLKTLQNLLAQNPKNGEIAWLIGNYHFMDCKFPAAFKAYEQAIQLNCANPGPKRSLAILLAAKGSQKKAVEYLKDIVETDADAEQATRMTTLYICLAGKTPQSGKIFDSLNQVYPDNTKVLESQLNFSMVVNDDHKIIEVLQKL